MSRDSSTAKRSPSILVTDARTSPVKGARAPFAGHNWRKQQLQAEPSRKKLARPNRYADISVDKLLSNSSDIPSGQRRHPTSPGSPGLAAQSSPPPSIMLPAAEPRKSIRSIPKLTQSLPSRTSKTSQKLVLIPDEQRISPPPTTSHDIVRSRAEVMTKEQRAQEFSRMTAYFICEEFDIAAVSKFLQQQHEVKPRMYDEALYVPYSFPLLPGDGFRVKSNNSAKLLPNKRYMEKMITKSEQADYLYEYYSGIETPEDANNYSMDPEYEESSGAFDPSEPQFFAPADDASSSENDDPRPAAAKTDWAEVGRHHGEMFVFGYGVVVFWNFSETHEKNILADLSFADDDPDPLLINAIDEQDIETEEFHFEYDTSVHRPRIYNDMITLRSGDHLIKLTMSHAIAQSTKLGLFESRMLNILQSISRLPKKLALTGQLGLRREQLLKKSGKLFKLRVDVNLSSSILDTPKFFWELEPALHPLYSAVREYLELDQRVQVINDRCKVFVEFVDIINDSINEKNTSRVTLLIIIIIFINLSVSLFEFLLQMLH